MRAVIADPSFGLLAVGFDHPTGPQRFATAAVWTSLKGKVWTPVSSPSFAGDGNIEMVGVASVAGGVVAVGDDTASSRRQADGQDAAVWSTLPTKRP
jgi:hypothetical protein